LVGLAVDSSGNLYIADSANQRVLQIASNGSVRQIAGNGRGYSGDGGPAADAQFAEPGTLAVDASGNLYVSDSSNGRIRRIAPDGIIDTVAGGASVGLGDGGSATAATLSSPFGIAIGSAGDLYIGDTGHIRIRRVSQAGTIDTVAGNGISDFNGDGGPAISARLTFFLWGSGMALDADHNLYIAGFNQRVRKISQDGAISSVASSGVVSLPTAVAVDESGVRAPGRAKGDVFVADPGIPGIVQIGKRGDTGFLETGVFAGGIYARGLAIDKSGNLYTASAGLGIRKISPDGKISSFPPGTVVPVPVFALTIDGAGNVYAADVWSYVVRKITQEGVVSVVAGNGTPGYSGDDGLATSAQLNTPAALAVDSSGNLYIADTFNHRIRRVSTSGIITTIAGNGSDGIDGDGGPATNAALGLISGLAVDDGGNVFLADQSYGAIRRLQPAPVPAGKIE
jgi:sugar lactone lactonase YvrE